MTEDRQLFIRELREVFAGEAQDHLQTLTNGLLALEKSPPPQEAEAAMEEVYRAAHSLKGAARAVNESGMETLAHAMESLFSAMRQGRISPAPETFDLLQRSLDLLGRLINAPGEVSESAVEAARVNLDSLAQGAGGDPEEGGPYAAPARAAGRAEAPPPPAAPPAGPQPKARVAGETVRVSVAKLESFLLKVEALLAARLTLEQRIADTREIAGGMALWKRDWKRLETRSGGAAGGGPEAFLDVSRPRMAEAEDRMNDLAFALRADHRALAAMVSDLLDEAKRILMFPFATLSMSFPKMVRDLARDQGKEAELLILGGEVEVDKRVLEEMKAPLVHLLRNCVDHGLEKPDVRERLGKPRQGRITVAVSEAEGDKLEITVSDDGPGIDAAAVRQATGGRNDLPDDLLGLVCLSGVTTSSMITDLSGRGLGLAIVQDAVNRLGGRTELATTPGAGASFRMVLPLTLATFQGVQVRAAGRDFVVPAANLERVVRVRGDAVRSVENREMISLNGQACALVRLAAILGLVQDRAEDAPEPAAAMPVLVLHLGNKRVALGVDALVGQQEVLMKGLGRHLTGLRNISGATVLGSGQVVPVLNPLDLLESATRTPDPAHRENGPEEKAPRTVLVVEDSITSRTLLKNILQSAGYRTLTAVDGMDGMTVLRAQPVDLVVLDIDMPRMNGFEMTEALRKDKKWAELPVVLVTARSSREDRERGLELGANAYIVKSSFDQGSLLEVIRRLI